MPRESTARKQDKAQEKRLRRTKKILIVAAILAFIFLGLAALFYRLNFEGGLSPDRGEWGQFGDFFGGTLNPILSLLSLIALLYTIYIQSHELALSRRELVETRNEMARSANALQQQNDAIAKENFEATYFRLLNKVDDIILRITSYNHEGKDAIRHIFHERWLTHIKQNPGSETSFSRLVSEYRTFYVTVDEVLSPYFRTLYHVFKFVDRSSLSDIEKSYYANIARAQLSTSELYMMLFNCALYNDGRSGLKPLIEKYGILKNFNANPVYPGMNMVIETYNVTGFESYVVRSEVIAERAAQSSAP